MQQSRSKSVGGRPADPLLSLVVPLRDEAETVAQFFATVRPLLTELGLRYEIICVDDGSRDSTLERLLEEVGRDSRVRVIELSRNFGKEAALTAGLEAAEGDAVVPIDVDLQDPPALIGTFIEKWREGYDVVYGTRAERASDTAVKRYSAVSFYHLFNRLAATPIPENTGDFRLLDRAVVEALRLLPERNRFMKGLFAWVGFRSIAVPYVRAPRAAGESKWGYWRLWNFALDGITGFSTVPLRVWTYIGATVALITFVFGTYLILRTIIAGTDVPGYASLMVVVLFLGGVQLLSLGMIGEYLGRLFLEAKQRPIYVVRRQYRQQDLERARHTKREPAAKA